LILLTFFEFALPHLLYLFTYRISIFALPSLQLTLDKNNRNRTETKYFSSKFDYHF
jgi:hypothetical protein